MDNQELQELINEFSYIDPAIISTMYESMGNSAEITRQHLLEGLRVEEQLFRESTDPEESRTIKPRMELAKLYTIYRGRYPNVDEKELKAAIQRCLEENMDNDEISEILKCMFFDGTDECSSSMEVDIGARQMETSQEGISSICEDYEARIAAMTEVLHKTLMSNCLQHRSINTYNVFKATTDKAIKMIEDLQHKYKTATSQPVIKIPKSYPGERKKDIEELDYHMYTVNECLSSLTNEIKKVAATLKDKQIARLRVIVGRGIHSNNGVCKLKPAVVNFCTRNGISCKEEVESYGGLLLLTITAREKTKTLK